MVRPPDEAAQAEAAALEIWNDLLRGYAEAVEQQRAYLLTSGSLDDVDEAMLVPPSFQIPAEVPPMPASLEPGRCRCSPRPPVSPRSRTRS
jgi:hypothetical protein